jgi:phenylacetate-CoA ligase
VNSIIVAWIADELEDVVAHTQFIQEEMGRVTINIVVEEDFTEHHERTLLERTRKMLGRDVEVTFNYMDSIPKERSGKVRFIINEVE